MSRVRDRVTYTPDSSDRASVFQMAAVKGGLSLAYRIAEGTPREQMEADADVDIAFLRRVFNFPFIDGDTSNEQLGSLIGEAITAALDNRQ